MLPVQNVLSSIYKVTQLKPPVRACIGNAQGQDCGWTQVYSLMVMALAEVSGLLSLKSSNPAKLEKHTPS